jgi:hypothetical protein
MRASQMNNYVLDRGLWVPASLRESIEFVEDKAAKFERMQSIAAQLVADYALKGPAGLMAMANPSGQVSQIDKLVVGFSPRFTAVAAGTLVRAGVGILVAVTLGIAAAAGGTVALFDGNGGAPAQISPTIDATKGPITLWIYQAFGQTVGVTTQGLYITVATAVTDAIIVTAGI